MFADPLPNVTYNAVAQVLPRLPSGAGKGSFRKADGSLVSTISHQPSNNIVRSMFRLDRFVDVNADNILEKSAIYVVYERPLSGFSETDMINLATATFGALTANSNEGLKKLNNQEA